MITPREYSAHAVILKRKNIGETDKVLTIFSRQYGKYSVLAKGIRKITSRRAGCLELFQEVTLYLHRGKTWDIVTDAAIVKAHPFINCQLMTICAAYYIVEILDVLLPDSERHDEVFMLATSALDQLVFLDPQYIHEHVTRYSQRLLTILGYAKNTIYSREFPDIIHEIERIIERKIRTSKFLPLLK